MMTKPLDKFIGRNLATETPSVINITGIAICPVSSKDLVKKIGVWILKYNNRDPNRAPHAIGSFNNFKRFFSPLTTHIPNVEEKMAITANIITA